MIFGIGIDDVDVERLRRRLGDTGGLKERVFTPREIEYCESRRSSAQNFAARFAAKEAFMKAVGTGWRDGLKFTDVEVVNNEKGKPELVLHGVAKRLVDESGITNVQVSLSHIRDVASAVVALEK
ncbi:MAG TPA: holo-ACP synthase [Acidobacteriota bacterium]|nr:holo-ACP synthase [Acidobacteriota bacterium]